MIGATGIWSEEEQGAHIFSYGVARWVQRNVNGLFYDFGAGSGEYTSYLRDFKRGVVSIDGFDSGAIDYVTDMASTFTIGHKRNVLCIEVFEHIPPQFESVFVDNIVRHCSGKLIISVAHEGQQGLGHVNCRPDWYVKELFEGKGFTFNEAQTKEIRSCAEGYVAYLRENLFVFDK